MCFVLIAGNVSKRRHASLNLKLTGGSLASRGEGRVERLALVPSRHHPFIFFLFPRLRQLPTLSSLPLSLSPRPLLRQNTSTNLYSLQRTHDLSARCLTLSRSYLSASSLHLPHGIT